MVRILLPFKSPRDIEDAAAFLMALVREGGAVEAVTNVDSFTITIEIKGH